MWEYREDFWAQRKQYIRILDEADGKQRSRIPSLIGKKENQKCPSPGRASGEAVLELGWKGWGGEWIKTSQMVKLG